MDQVFPAQMPDVDAADAYRRDERPSGSDRPWVAVNMVASVDGAVTVEGRSGGLSGPSDKAIFFALRSIADVVLVGAGTVRAEDYGPPRTSADDQAAREARGQAPSPTIAVVSGRLDLDPAARLFADTPTRPIVFTTSAADPGRRRALDAVADVVSAGDARIEPELALAALYQRGARVVVCEGGPTLNGTLLERGLVDELCLTVSPVLVSGEDPRVIRGGTVHPPDRLLLDRALVEDGFVFFRYVSDRTAGAT